MTFYQSIDNLHTKTWDRSNTNHTTDADGNNNAPEKKNSPVNNGTADMGNIHRTIRSSDDTIDSSLRRFGVQL